MQGEVDPDAVLELFKLLEFPSLVPRLAEAFPHVFGDAVRAGRRARTWSRPRSPGRHGREMRSAALVRLAGSTAETVAVAGAWDGEPPGAARSTASRW